MTFVVLYESSPTFPKYMRVWLEDAFPVETMCRVLGVTRSGFYAWKKRPKPARAKSDAQLAVKVAAAHQRSRKTSAARGFIAS